MRTRLLSDGGGILAEARRSSAETDDIKGYEMPALYKLTNLQMTSRDFWPALHRLSAALRNSLKSVSDGNQLSDQIFDPLKPESGFADSAKFASGAHKALRIHFWEMVVSHVETIEEALARVHF